MIVNYNKNIDGELRKNTIDTDNGEESINNLHVHKAFPWFDFRRTTINYEGFAFMFFYGIRWCRGCRFSQFLRP